jgi:hypothetical protein
MCAELATVPMLTDEQIAERDRWSRRPLKAYPWQR